MPKRIRWRLKVQMAIADINNRDLAKALGISEVTVSRWRNSEYFPNLTEEHLAHLCDVLSCQLTDLMLLEEEVSKR